ncbi:hypothetical protein, conserved [Eimeria praecox]|uniref:Uncharacterized protein n=1 Tax=Eimeria praecox TaxID=51316 RepID=U6H8Y7_9EIME|nr:hypothetical protein, conserved [Eimeria praecox]
MEQRRLSEGGRQGGSGSPAGGMDGDLSSVDDMQQHVEWAQKILDDRTLVPIQQKRVQEKPHSVLHLLWGAALVLLVIFMRRLPRFPGVIVPERLEQGDPLMYWEAKNIIGDNPEEGMQLRLRNNPHVAQGFHDFAQLSRESFDRRDKSAQRIHEFQKQMVAAFNPKNCGRSCNTSLKLKLQPAAFNPVIVVTDRMVSLVKQLPPLAETLPRNAEELRAQLQHLVEAEAAASDKKDEFLDEWNINRMRKDLYSNPMVATALRRLVDIDSTYMHKRIALLEFLVSEAMKATEGAVISPVVKKEMQSLESKAQAAAAEAAKAAEACMELLPKQDHWMLLLFVEKLGQAPTPSAAGNRAN